jgi:hypothetical protein
VETAVQHEREGALGTFMGRILFALTGNLQLNYPRRIQCDACP